MIKFEKKWTNILKALESHFCRLEVILWSTPAKFANKTISPWAKIGHHAPQPPLLTHTNFFKLRYVQNMK